MCWESRFAAELGKPLQRYHAYLMRLLWAVGVMFILSSLGLILRGLRAAVVGKSGQEEVLLGAVVGVLLGF
uniref:Uncharacterized protein n=1 Tax=viral metagenome TaxID=1070528 RepID=A0A6M3XB09_9ZZZZ